MSEFPQKLTYRQILIAVLLVLFAFSLRSVLIVERAIGDPVFIPNNGFDQERYVDFANGILDGTWPTEPYFYHPAPSYLNAAIFAITDRSIPLLYFVYALIDSLSVGWLIGATWLITRKAWSGYLAGMIFAIFPYALHYGTSLIIASTATALLALFTFLLLWQRNRFIFWRTVILALCAGWLILSRKNLAPLAGLYILWMLILPITWKQRIINALAYVVIIGAVMLPFTLHNYRASGGEIILVATTGEQQLLMANNRDSNARPELRTPSMDAIRDNYTAALIDDIRATPVRFVELLAYKFAVFWNDFETAGNVNFYAIQDISRILQLNPIQWSWVIIPAFVGLGILFYDDRATALLLATYIAWICFGFVLTFAMARLRYPMIVPLTILTAYAIQSFVTRTQTQTLTRQFALQQVAPPLVLAVALIGYSNFVLNPEPKLPSARIYQTLPDDTITLDIPFENVTLVGWRPYAPHIWQSAQNGWIEALDTYTIELFWRLDAPTTSDYRFNLAYVFDGIAYNELVMPIGHVSWPDRGTSTWQVGTVYGEIVTFRVEEDILAFRSGDVRIGVWRWTDSGEINTIETPSGETSQLLQTLAMFPIQPADTMSGGYTFGDVIRVGEITLPTTLTPDDTLTLELDILPLETLNQNYRLFTHVLDQEGNLATQNDGLPIPDLLTSNWRPNVLLENNWQIPLPTEAGIYQVVMGFYNETGRLATNEPNDTISLGTITVTE